MPHVRSNSRRHARFSRHQADLKLHAQKKIVQAELKKATTFDHETKEQICHISAIELAWNSKLPCVTSIVPRVEPGEVLSDPRGQGTIDQDRYIFK